MARKGRPVGKSNADYAAERALKEAAEEARRQDLLRGGSLATAQKAQTVQDKVVTRQKADLVHLQATIKESMKLLRSMHAAGVTDAAAVGQVTRSMERLHLMEREAHGFNKRTSAIKAIILLPVPSGSIGDWAAAAESVLGRDHLPDQVPSRLVAPDEEPGEE